MTYDPNNVFVVLVPDPAAMAIAGQTFNQRSVAGATGNLGAIFLQLATIPQNQLLFSLDQLSGEVHASNLSAGLENHSLFLRTVAERLRQSRCLCGQDAANPGCEADDGWRTWGTPFGQAGSTAGNGNAHGFDYQSVGFAAGTERWLEESTFVGLTAGYNNWENNTDRIGSRATADSLQAGIYAYQQIGAGWALGTVRA